MEHTTLPLELVFDRNEPDWDTRHHIPSSQSLLRSQSHDMVGGPAAFGKHSLRSRASLLLCRSQADDYEVPSLNAFAMERQFKVERQQIQEKLLNPHPPLSQNKAKLRGARQHSLLRGKQAATRIEKSVRPGAPLQRSIAVIDADDDETSILTEEVMMAPSNRGFASVNDSRAGPTVFQGCLGLETSSQCVAPSLRTIAVREVDDEDDEISFLTEEVMMAPSNRGFASVNDSRAGPTVFQGCLGLETSSQCVAPSLRTIAVREVDDEDDEISFLTEEVMMAPSNRDFALVNGSRADPTGLQRCLGLEPSGRRSAPFLRAIAVIEVDDEDEVSIPPLRKRPPRDAIETSCLNAESPTSVMDGANYSRVAEEPDWEGTDLEFIALQRELKALNRWNVVNRSFTEQHRKCVRFAHPLVTSVKLRPFTKPEDLSLLFFDQGELTQLEADRNNSIPEEEFECIATPAGKPFQISISFPSRRLPRRDMQQQPPRLGSDMIHI